MNLSAILLGLARRLMPPHRAQWLDAMRAESHYLEAGERLRWAVGCVVTALKQRIAPMDTGNFRVSRAVVFIETLGAFGPLTLGWWVLVLGPAGLINLTPALIDKVFMHSAGGIYIFSMQLAGAIVGLLGPIGLFLGLRFVLTGQGLRNRGLGWTLVAIPIATHVLGMLAGYVTGPADFGYTLSGFWFYTVMLTAVPIAVIWHLMVLARPDTSAPSASVVAA